MNTVLELGQREFAALCGVSVTAIIDWEGEGMPPPRRASAKSALYDVRVCLPWVRDNKWKRDQDDRARKLKAEADLAEMERDLQAGKLLLVEDAEREWTATLAGIRARLLSIPPKIGALLSSNLTVAQRSEIVRREIHEALTTLSGPPVPIEVEDDEPEAPAKPEKPRTIKRRPGRPPKNK